MNELKIYLDHNAAVDVMTSRDANFAEAVYEIKDSGAKFVYSPAHIEEVANILRSPKLSDTDSQKFIEEHLDFFSSLTDNWEFLPGQRLPVILKQEDPRECYARVIDRYDLTHFAEYHADIERAGIENQRSVPTPLEVCDLPVIRERIDELLFYAGFDEPVMGPNLRNSHSPAVWMIHTLFGVLSENGYGLEPASGTRSAIHDVTHAVYGLSADIFVSNDRRLLGKAKASYRFLKAESRVMSPDEFSAFVKNPN